MHYRNSSLGYQPQDMGLSPWLSRDNFGVNFFHTAAPVHLAKCTGCTLSWAVVAFQPSRSGKLTILSYVFASTQIWSWQCHIGEVGDWGKLHLASQKNPTTFWQFLNDYFLWFSHHLLGIHLMSMMEVALQIQNDLIIIKSIHSHNNTEIKFI